MAGEWEERKWGEIATLEYGKGLRGYEDAAGPYRVYGTNGPIGWTDAPLCMHEGVVVGRKGAYRGIHYSDKPFFAIDTAFYLEPKEDIDMRWAYYCLLTYDINRMDSGSAIPSTSREAFYRLPVRVPPPDEQQAIACILGALDDKIELNRRMSRTLEETARAIFKSWFVDFDPVRAKATGQHPPGMKPEIAALFPDAFVDSELGRIPEGWEAAALSEIATFLNGLALQNYAPLDSDALPVIKIAQLRKGDTQGADLASADIGGDYIVRDGDIVFSWSGSLVCRLWTGGAGALNQHLFKVTSDAYPQWFCYFWVHEHLPEFVRIAAGKATTMGHIRRHHLDEAQVIVPSPALLARASGAMGPLLDASIQCALETRTLAQLRDTLLPRLISGDLPIPDADTIVERCI